MAKYLKEFETNAEYEAYINGNPDLPNVSLIDDDDSVKYNEYIDYSKQYLTFVALEDGTFKFTKKGSGTLQYSLNSGTTWTSLADNTNSPTVQSGNTIMWKGNLTTSSSIGVNGIGRFSSTGLFNVHGNVMSLKYGDNFIGNISMSDKQFSELFYYTKIVNAKNLILPSTTLKRFCYYQMFERCTSLTTAPELPALTLAYNCYGRMFYTCSSLTKAPELPATTLADACYSEMFRTSTNLNYIKMLATNISASGCLSQWVSGVAATGTFVKSASQTSLPSGASGIPANWTVQNI